jgi:hypothetical protein
LQTLFVNQRVQIKNDPFSVVETDSAFLQIRRMKQQFFDVIHILIQRRGNGRSQFELRFLFPSARFLLFLFPLILPGEKHLATPRPENPFSYCFPERGNSCKNPSVPTGFGIQMAMMYTELRSFPEDGLTE